METIIFRGYVPVSLRDGNLRTPGPSANVVVAKVSQLEKLPSRRLPLASGAFGRRRKKHTSSFNVCHNLDLPPTQDASGK